MDSSGRSSSRSGTPPRWIVFSQADTPTFQQTLAYASQEVGPGLLVDASSEKRVRGNLRISPGPRYRRGTMVQRLWSWTRFAWHAHRVLGRVAARPSAGSPFVLAVTTPPFLPNVVARYARRHGMRYGVVVYDTFPDHVVEAGILRDTNPIVRVWKKMNDTMYRHAETIITIGDAMAEHLHRALPDDCAGRAIHVVPIGADTSLFKPMPRSASAFAVEHGLQDKFVILYCGNMSPTHRLETLAELADRLRHRETIHFLFVGRGLALGDLRRAFEERRIENVTFVEHQPWELMPQVYATADMAVISQAPGTEHLSVPSKIFPHLACGNAILALTRGDSDLARLVEKSEAGLVFPHEATEQIGEAITRMVESDTDLSRLKEKALVASTDYSSQAMGARWGEILRSHV